MDIRCPICSEPWDMDELNDAPNPLNSRLTLPFDEARKIFYEQGCGVLFGNKPCVPANPEAAERAQISAILGAMLGDDIDGIACMEEDYDFCDG